MTIEPVPATIADLDAYHRNEHASFHMPGHKQGRGTHPLASRVLGDVALRNDVSEMGGFDYLHAPEGALARAQQRSAQIFGAQRTYFLVNGSTVGNIAAILSQTSDGDGVTLLRGSHRSAYTALALTGARPNYLPAIHDPARGGWFVVSPPSSVPIGTKVIHVTRPNYYGMAIDLGPYRALADAAKAILVVDEAHGSHFGTDRRLPRNALQEGADLVIQSTHKTLSALTQASMLHVGLDLEQRINHGTLLQTLSMLQSSSPSALLTMSLDLAAEEHAREGYAATGRVVDISERVRQTLVQTLIRVELFNAPNTPTLAFDPTKLVFDVSLLGINGFDARSWLRLEQHVNVELADDHRVVCSLAVGDDENSADVLIRAFTALDRNSHVTSSTFANVNSIPEPQLAMTPRLAVNALADSVATEWALGRICADYVIPYPPGIPLVAPGEILTSDVLQALDGFRRSNARIVGPYDQTLKTLRVVR